MNVYMVTFIGGLVAFLVWFIYATHTRTEEIKVQTYQQLQCMHGGKTRQQCHEEFQRAREKEWMREYERNEN